MTPEFWLNRWERGEIGWHQTEINVHLQAYWPQLDLAPDTQVFVPLCGKSLDMLWLVSRGHRVLGVEISEPAIRSFFQDHELHPQMSDKPPFRRYVVDELEILVGDYFQLTACDLAEVGAVFDRASLIALPPGMRPRYSDQFKAIVPTTATCFLITLDYDQEEMSGPPFAVTDEEVSRLFSDRYRIESLASFDIIDDAPRFRQRGLTALREQVWQLQPREDR
ncbi:thiopurine S-methyltransferase [Thiocapsa imhoffii]|uniref:Thiopurine S-methyltransferase n=1 Tax=Thiocapsa imhoffii TaxID=382777 RepID=A0A9X1B8U6_9GAMM|nr:thiopurine S-methyltransferase [Thiocapsa imhoffii]MBK1644405.1 thiopurine S-methyltransferase [Thiocapsa imhoffii]